MQHTSEASLYFNVLRAPFHFLCSAFWWLLSGTYQSHAKIQKFACIHCTHYAWNKKKLFVFLQVCVCFKPQFLRDHAWSSWEILREPDQALGVSWYWLEHAFPQRALVGRELHGLPSAFWHPQVSWWNCMHKSSSVSSHLSTFLVLVKLLTVLLCYCNLHFHL